MRVLKTVLTSKSTKYSQLIRAALTPLFKVSTGLAARLLPMMATSKFFQHFQYMLYRHADFFSVYWARETTGKAGTDE
jgi:hypothetical protein